MEQEHHISYAPLEQALNKREVSQAWPKSRKYRISSVLTALFALVFMQACWAGGEKEQQGSQALSTKIQDAPIEPEYTLKQGSQFDLCRNYVDLMNRVTESPIDDQARMIFPFDDIAKKQGFREIHWREELDKNEYKELLRHQNIYTRTNPPKNYGYLSKEEQRAYLQDKVKARIFAYYEKDFNRDFNDIRRLWRTRMDMNFDGKTDTVYRIAYCPEGNLEFGVRCNNYIFLYDKEQPYEQFFTERIAKTGISGHQFYYKGRPYNYWSGGLLAELYGGANRLWEKNICEIWDENGILKIRLREKRIEKVRQEQARKKALRQQGQTHD